MKKTVFLIAFVLCLGCSRPSQDGADPMFFVGSESDSLSTELQEVRKEFKNLDSEDQDSIYKQVTGAALFLKHNTIMKESSDFDPILSRVQSDFGWDREKYQDFTDAVSEYLIAEGYDEPRLLDSNSDRNWLFSIFNNLSTAIKYD